MTLIGGGVGSIGRVGGGRRLATSAPLAAITGERAAFGVHFGGDNALQADLVSGRGVVLPNNAVRVNQAGDWTILIDVLTGAGAMGGGTGQREMIATAGTSTTGNLATGNNRFLFRNALTRRLFIGGRTENATGGYGDFITGGGTAPIDTGITLLDHTAYLVAVGQKGSFPYVRAVQVDTGVVQEYTGADNRSAGGFYLLAAGGARASTAFDNFFTTLGCWASGGSTARQGWTGSVGAIAHSFSAFTDAELQAIASGAVSFGSLPALNYWNQMRFTAGSTVIAAQATNNVGAAITVTGAANVVIQGSLLTTPVLNAGPFRSASLIKLQREIGPYTFPLMPGRTTGRVWFDGVNNAPAGYAIHGRLGTTIGGADVLPATQLAASHAGGAFRFTRDGIPKETTFFRSVWVGPATSTPFGSDGHTYDEATPMKIATKAVYIHQSQGARQLDNTTAQGTGATVVPAPPANGWILARYPNVQTGFSTTNASPVLAAPIGPRSLTVTGTVGEGLMAKLNRTAAMVGSVDEVFGARPGHSLDAFAYDGTAQVTQMTGTGTARTGALNCSANGAGMTSAVANLSGVNPGSVSVSWSGGTITDLANLAMTGAQLVAANTQVFPAALGVTGTINYYTGVLSLTFASDPGVVTVNWVTRFDTGEGNQTAETVPDKYTLFGSTVVNGHLTRMLGVSPRHGFSFIYWGGATSNIAEFAVGTEAAYEAARNAYGAKLGKLRERFWAISDGTNPPIILGYYGRGSGLTENNNMRRARRDLALSSDAAVSKRYNPAAATDGTSGATASNYRWWSGFTSHSLQNNAGEHQDAQAIGGRLMGEQEGYGYASLMLGDQNIARGPEFLSARIKAGAPNTIEVIPTFYRAGATALVVDTARGGSTSNLFNWSVQINPSAINVRGNGATDVPEPITASLNTTTGHVELVRTAGAWPDSVANVLQVRHKAYGIMMDNEVGGVGTTAADEAQLATALWDNAGGYSGIRPGAETMPVFGLRVA